VVKNRPIPFCGSTENLLLVLYEVVRPRRPEQSVARYGRFGRRRVDPGGSNEQRPALRGFDPSRFRGPLHSGVLAVHHNSEAPRPRGAGGGGESHALGPRREPSKPPGSAGASVPSGEYSVPALHRRATRRWCGMPHYRVSGRCHNDWREDMDKIKVIHAVEGKTLTLWFDDPAKKRCARKRPGRSS